jgi:hypothetical protein
MVFLISGLWHGANWTFIIWGALHGCYLMLEMLSDVLFPGKTLVKPVRWFINFSLVTLAWVFFRAENMQTAKQVLWNIITWKPGPLYVGNAAYLLYGIGLIIFLMAADYNTETLKNKYSLIYHPHRAARWSGYILLILTMLTIGVFNGGQFIYFQF